MGRGRIRKFRLLAGREKRLFLEAFFFHLVTGLVLKVVPFRMIPRVFGSPQSSVLSPQSPVGSLSLRRRRRVNPVHVVSGWESEDIELIRMAVQRAGSVSPWRNRCLVSSLAGRCMLRRRKIESQLYLGMTKTPGGRPSAHAWLLSGETEIVSKQGDYIPLYVF